MKTRTETTKPQQSRNGSHNKPQKDTRQQIQAGKPKANNKKTQESESVSSGVKQIKKSEEARAVKKPGQKDRTEDKKDKSGNKQIEKNKSQILKNAEAESKLKENETESKKKRLQTQGQKSQALVKQQKNINENKTPNVNEHKQINQVVSERPKENNLGQEKPNQPVIEQIAKNNYAQTLMKYKQLGGKQKGVIFTKSPIKSRSPNKMVDSQVKNNQKSRVHQKLNQLSVQVQKITPNNNIPKQVEKTQTSLIKNGSSQIKQIKIITQKQYDLAELAKIEVLKDQSESTIAIREKVDLLNSTRRSLSLPTIPKPDLTPTITAKEKRQKITVENTKEKGLTQAQKLEKERSLNSVAFLLTNIREKLSSREVKSRSLYKSSKMFQNTSTKEGQPSFYTQLSPYQTKTKTSLFELSNTPSRVITKQTPKSKTIQPNFQQQKEDQIMNSPIERFKSVQSIPAEGQAENKKSVRYKQVNNRLEQIKEDIQNENNQKEELLKEHRSMNKNLQISVIKKRQRITQLQAEIDQYESFQTNKNKQGIQVENLQIAELQQQKAKKQKLYKQEKNKLKAEITQIEKKIVEQENKFMHLRETEIQIKGDEIANKERQMETRNKQMNEELSKKRKQLEEAIEKEKEKSKMYQLQLEQQTKKNAEISTELRKQEQLQQMLLQRIERIVKERRRRAQLKEVEKEKERNRLLQEIKELEETQNRLLMEYQRDSQSATSIFQAMRMKNLELEQKIKRSRREQKQKEGASEIN